VRRRAFLSFAFELLRREPLLKYARHLLAIHLELSADLLRPETALVFLHERDHFVERLGDLLGGASLEAKDVSDLTFGEYVRLLEPHV
jgi:hypothetical protein